VQDETACVVLIAAALTEAHGLRRQEHVPRVAVKAGQDEHPAAALGVAKARESDGQSLRLVTSTVELDTASVK
jgi:hypothetical protein